MFNGGICHKLHDFTETLHGIVLSRVTSIYGLNG